MDLRTALSQQECLVISAAPSDIPRLLQALYGKKVCYVSLNKPVSRLRKALFLHHVPSHFFIDAVSRGLGEAKESSSTVFLSSPAALEELQVSLQEVLSSSVEVVVIDAVSTLSIYHRGKEAEGTLRHLVGMTREKGKKILLITAEDDELSQKICNLGESLPKEFSQHHNARSALLPPVLGAGLLVGVLLLFSEPHLTGAAVLSSVPDRGLTFREMGTVALLLGLVLWGFFRNIGIHPLPFLRLASLASPRRSMAQLRRETREKIRGWEKER